MKRRGLPRGISVGRWCPGVVASFSYWAAVAWVMTEKPRLMVIISVPLVLAAGLAGGVVGSLGGGGG